MNEEIDVLDVTKEVTLDRLGEDKIEETPVIISNVEDKDKEFLPLGSVVLLKEASKKLMIVGFLTSRVDDEEVFDYAGCLFPEGVLSSDESLLFNEEDIEEVIALGYKNEETDEFNLKLKEIINKNEK